MSPPFLVITDMDYYPCIDGVVDAESAEEALAQFRTAGPGDYSFDNERVYVVRADEVLTHDDGAYINRLTEDDPYA